MRGVLGWGRPLLAALLCCFFGGAVSLLLTVVNASPTAAQFGEPSLSESTEESLGVASATYRVTLTNQSDNRGPGLILQSQLISEDLVVSVDPPCREMEDGGGAQRRVVCEFGVELRGDSEVFGLTFARGERARNISFTVATSDGTTIKTFSINVPAMVDLSDLSLRWTEDGRTDSAATYRVTVGNSSSNNVNDVVVGLSVGGTVTDSDGDPLACPRTGPNGGFECRLGSLGPDAAESIRVVYDLEASGFEVDVTAEATGQQLVRPEQGSIPVPAARAPALPSLSESTEESLGVASATYRVTLTNQSDNRGPGLILQSQLISEDLVVSVDPPCREMEDGGGAQRRVVCEFGVELRGDSEVFGLTFARGEEPLTISFTVTASDETTVIETFEIVVPAAVTPELPELPSLAVSFEESLGVASATYRVTLTNEDDTRGSGLILKSQTLSDDEIVAVDAPCEAPRPGGGAQRQVVCVFGVELRGDTEVFGLTFARGEEPLTISFTVTASDETTVIKTFEIAVPAAETPELPELSIGVLYAGPSRAGGVEYEVELELGAPLGVIVEGGELSFSTERADLLVLPAIGATCDTRDTPPGTARNYLCDVPRFGAPVPGSDPVGGPATALVTLRFVADDQHEINNIAFAAPNGGRATIEPIVVPQPLEVSVDDRSGRLRPDGNYEYVVTVTNPTAFRAENVVIDLNYPDGSLVLAGDPPCEPTLAFSAVCEMSVPGGSVPGSSISRTVVFSPTSAGYSVDLDVRAAGREQVEGGSLTVPPAASLGLEVTIAPSVEELELGQEFVVRLDVTVVGDAPVVTSPSGGFGGYSLRLWVLGEVIEVALPDTLPPGPTRLPVRVVTPEAAVGSLTVLGELFRIDEFSRELIGADTDSRSVVNAPFMTGEVGVEFIVEPVEAGELLEFSVVLSARDDAEFAEGGALIVASDIEIVVFEGIGELGVDTVPGRIAVPAAADSYWLSAEYVDAGGVSRGTGLGRYNVSEPIAALNSLAAQFGSESTARSQFPHCVVELEAGSQPTRELCFETIEDAVVAAGRRLVSGRFFLADGSSLTVVQTGSVCTGLRLDLAGRYLQGVIAFEGFCELTRLDAEGFPPIKIRKSDGLVPLVEDFVTAQAFFEKAVNGLATDGSAAAREGFQQKIADPVQVATGNFLESEADLGFGLGILGMDFGRTYSAASTPDFVREAQRVPTLLGPGWRLSHHITATKAASGAVEITNGDGRILRFQPNDDGSFQRPAGFYADLLVVEGQYVVGNFDGTRWFFDGGLDVARVTRMEFADGQVVTLAYNDDGHLISIVSSTGASYRLVYSNDRLSSVEALNDGVVDRTVGYGYSDDGNLATVTDPEGHQSRYVTSPEGLIEEIFDETGVLAVRNVYDDADRVVLQETGAGETAEFIYDAFDSVTTVRITGRNVDNTFRTDVFEFTHDDSGHTIDIRDPRSRQVQIGRDDNGEATQTRDRRASANEDLAASTSIYDDDGNLLAVTIPGEGTYRYEYLETIDETGARQFRLAVSDPPDAEPTRYSYQGTNPNPVRIEAPLGNTTINTIDERGLVVATQDADGVTTTFVYDDARNVTSVQDGAGNVTTFAYDDAHRVVSVTDPSGETAEVVYDELGRVLETIDRTGAASTATYDTAGRVTSSVDRLGGTMNYAYDYNERSGLPTSVTDLRAADSIARTTGYEFDEFSEVTKVILPGNDARPEIAVENNSLGRITAVSDPLGRTVGFDHDLEGAVEQFVLPEGMTMAMTRDEADRITSIRDINNNGTTIDWDPTTGQMRSHTSGAFNADGTIEPDLAQTITYTYDNAGRIRTVTGPRPNETRTYEYSPAGRLRSLTDPLGRTTTYTYDNAGRPANIDLPDVAGEAPRTTSLAYDSNSRTTAITYPGDLTTRFEYDNEDRPTDATSPAGIASQVTYNPDGDIITAQLGADQSARFDRDSAQLNAATDPNGGTSSYGYDHRYNMVSSTDQNGNQTTYTYDLADQVTAVTDPLGRSRTITYNDRGYVKTRTDASGRTFDTTYDDAGRRTTVTYKDDSTKEYTYDALNRVTSITDQPENRTVSYTYDIAGNLTSVTEPDGDTIKYTWDLAGNQTQLTYPDGTRVDYTYDNLNRLQTATHSTAGTTTYTYDQASRLSEVTYPDQTRRTFDYTGELLTSFGDGGQTWNLSYDPSGRLTDITGDDTWHFAYDNGSQLLSATHNNDTWTYTHDPVGNITHTTAPNTEPQTFTHDAANQIVTSTAAIEPDQTETPTNPPSNENVEPGQTEAPTNPASTQGPETADASSQTTAPPLTTVAEQTQTTTQNAAPKAAVPAITTVASATLGAQTSAPTLAQTGQESQPIANTAILAIVLGTITLAWSRRLNAHAKTRTPDRPRQISVSRYFAAICVALIIALVADMLVVAADPTQPEPASQTAIAPRFEHDAAGRLTRSTEPNGATTSYAYDIRGRITTVHTQRDSIDNESPAINDLWERTYTPDGLVDTVTHTDTEGSTKTWNLNWDRTRNSTPLGWTGTDNISLVHGIGPALAVNDNQATNITLNPLGDIINSPAAAADNYGPYGQTNPTFGLGYRNELHIGPTIHLDARTLVPNLQRMLTVDPITPPPGTAATTRYAYAANDPINQTDPTGLVPDDDYFSQSQLKQSCTADSDFVRTNGEKAPLRDLRFDHCVGFLEQSVAAGEVSVAWHIEASGKNCESARWWQSVEVCTFETQESYHWIGPELPDRTGTDTLELLAREFLFDWEACGIGDTEITAWCILEVVALGGTIIGGATALRSGAQGIRAARATSSLAKAAPSTPLNAAGEAFDGVPEVIYRGGSPSPSNLTPRPTDNGMLSFRDSLSNPWPLAPGQRPVFQPGKPYFGVDTDLLPPGSVIPDGVPPGHVSVLDVDPAALREAVIEASRGKFPK